MGRLPKIIQYINNALDGISLVGRKVVGGSSMLDLEKDVWTIYKDCESAVFLIKLEILDVEAPDKTKLEVNLERPDYAIFLAEDYLKNAKGSIDKEELKKALEETRSARNVMAEVYSQVKKENLRIIRENRKRLYQS